MLKQRIITALVLLGLFILVLTVARPWGFPLFALLLVGVVIGEWLSLLGHSRTTTLVVAGLTMLLLWLIDSSAYAARVVMIVWIATAIVWLALALCLFIAGRFPPSDRWRWLHAGFALLLPGACWFALVAAYRNGLVFLISILAIVWAADIAAYFAGRAFGKKKLAPSISPGKTWAGAVGGAIAVMIVALIALEVPQLSNSFFAVLGQRWPLIAVLAAVLVLVILSIVGDLFESQLKRQHGVKDSGRLLPGHGGVFDRVDALLPVVPVAMLISLAA